MKKLTFSVRISAPREKVWNILWNDATYRQWTSVFHEGSHAESDWNEGSRILFLSPEKNGMYSEIARKIPYEFMSFRHIGEYKNGKELPSAEWAGSMENYTLNDTGDETHLQVEMDADENYESFFNGVFPKALQKVKELSEAG